MFQSQNRSLTRLLRPATYGLMLLALIVLGAGALLPSGSARAQDACTFATNLQDAPLYHAPVTHATQQKDVVPVGEAFPVLAQSGEHYYIAFDHAYGGWVDRRSGGLSGDCDALPTDPRPISEYPTVCTITVSAPVPAFEDADLTVGKGDLGAGTYVAIGQAPRAVLALIDHAMAVWVPNTLPSFSGPCDTLPMEGASQAIARGLARVWTEPDVNTGDILYTLPEGGRVTVLAGPVLGPIRYDTAEQGEWYQVVWGPYAAGWVWSERLDLLVDETPTTPAPQQATALPNARLWTQPNVRTGTILATVPAGSTVGVVSGPVLGPIRYDTTDQGDWYLVAWRDVSGWAWVERLAFD